MSGVVHAHTPDSCAELHGTSIATSSRARKIETPASPPSRLIRIEVPPDIGPLLGATENIGSLSHDCSDSSTAALESSPQWLLTFSDMVLSCAASRAMSCAA